MTVALGLLGHLAGFKIALLSAPLKVLCSSGSMSSKLIATLDSGSRRRPQRGAVLLSELVLLLPQSNML